MKRVLQYVAACVIGASLCLSVAFAARPSGGRLGGGGGGNASGAFMYITGGVLIPINPAYFTAGTQVLRYINPTTGSDSNDGTSPTVAGTVGPWATVQRWMDDIPDGFLAAPIGFVAAGTFAGTQTWSLHAIPGAGFASARLIGDCSVPQATFTTTGVGVAVVSGSGVTKLAQFTFVPTVATGSIPVIAANGDYWLETVATNVPNIRVVMAGGGAPNLVLAVPASTAIVSATLCPWATTFSGAVTVSGANPPTVAQVLQIHGISFSNLSASNNLNVNGNRVVDAAQTYTMRGNLQNNLVNAQSVLVGSVFTSTATVSGNVFGGTNKKATVRGYLTTLTGNVFGGTSAPKLSFGLTTVNENYFHSGVDNAAGNDFEGASDAVYLASSSFTQTGAGQPMASFDITGGAFMLNFQSLLHVRGVLSGRYTVATAVHSQSGIYLNSAANWTAINSAVAGDDFMVGSAGTYALAALPVTDLDQLARASDTDR